MKWKLSHIEKLAREGKIRGFELPKQEEVNGKIVSKAFKKPVSKQKEWLEETLLYWCNAKGYQLIEEYRFWPERKFKADYFIPALNVLIEYEGGVFMKKSGHSNAKGYTKDLEKYNKVSQMGFKLLRFNAINYKSLLTELNNIK